MTKRDAIEAMAGAIEAEAIKRKGYHETIANGYSDSLAFANAAYERFAEMSKAERQSRCSVTGQPLTIRQQFESECG